MARTPSTARWRGTRHRVLVLSLLAQDLTAETTTGPVPGVTTRARSRRAATAFAALPEDILVWEVFARLPAKDILRCRAVCRSWHILTSAVDFVLAHHRRQPSSPLVTLYGTASADPIYKGGSPVLWFDDYDGFKIHASCDGLLLLSLSDRCFSICNPTTRQCAPLPGLPAADCITVAALYQHGPSGEYLVLYWKGTDKDHLKAAYYILVVPQGRSPRCIGVPSHPPGIEKVMMAWHGTAATNLAPPVVFRNYLHWDPGCLHSDAGIVAFDTVAESFRFIRRPAGANEHCTSLCDMGPSIGFSCFDDARTVARIWVLEDYDKEIWSLKYHVKIPRGTLCTIPNPEHLVLSHKGDVLVYNCSKPCMLRCDNTGKLLEEFQCNSWSMSLTGHCLKESLAKHDFFLRRGRAWDEQQFFKGSKGTLT